MKRREGREVHCRGSRNQAKVYHAQAIKGERSTNWTPSKYRTFEKETHRRETVSANLISDKGFIAGFYKELTELNTWTPQTADVGAGAGQQS